MGEIILVRHGQANSHATTEEDYDRLSELGHQQARWLGDWFRAHDYVFDHVVSGTMRRHRETVAGLGLVADEDARLNEIDYYTLSHALHHVKGEPLPTGDTFAAHMPKVFQAWRAAEIEGAEPYHAFETRVAALLDDATQPGRRVLCVTSGGVIGMVGAGLISLLVGLLVRDAFMQEWDVDALNLVAAICEAIDGEVESLPAEDGANA